MRSRNCHIRGGRYRHFTCGYNGSGRGGEVHHRMSLNKSHMRRSFRNSWNTTTGMMSIWNRYPGAILSSRVQILWPSLCLNWLLKSSTSTKIKWITDRNIGSINSRISNPIGIWYCDIFHLCHHRSHTNNIGYVLSWFSPVFVKVVLQEEMVLLGIPWVRRQHFMMSS